jgi:hypothetical protein
LIKKKEVPKTDQGKLEVMKKRDQPNKIVQNVPEKATGKKVM